jgi:DNA-directed RNA polymerase subunit F
VTAYNEIRKILQKDENRMILSIVAPTEYQDMRVSYCKGHKPPSEQKQKRDLELLRKYLKV